MKVLDLTANNISNINIFEYANFPNLEVLEIGYNNSITDFESFGKIPYTIGKVAVDVGDDIFVLGYPLTSSMGKEVKLTDGIISSSTGYKGDEAMYQISAPVQPGNSGGPLFNEDGDVIGVVCAKHAEAENANYAVKINYLSSLISASQLDIQLPNSNKIKINNV